MSYSGSLGLKAGSLGLKAFSFISLQNSLFLSGYALYFHGTLFIISLISLLDISHEGLHWRYWLLYVCLWQRYWRFYYPTSFIFYCHFSLRMPFSWQFSPKIQLNSTCKQIIIWKKKYFFNRPNGDVFQLGEIFA